MKLFINKEGQIKSLGNIEVILDNAQILNPNPEELARAGWTPYQEPEVKPEPRLKPDEWEIEKAVILFLKPRKEQIEALPDSAALPFKALHDCWADYVGKPVKEGKRLYYDDKLYKVRQTHTVQKEFAPSVDTASLYEEVNETAKGSLDDPIPYNNNMRLELGKYYSQYGKKYKCTRDSEVAVYNDLPDLIGIYVELIK